MDEKRAEPEPKMNRKTAPHNRWTDVIVTVAGIRDTVVAICMSSSDFYRLMVMIMDHKRVLLFKLKQNVCWLKTWEC